MTNTSAPNPTLEGARNFRSLSQTRTRDGRRLAGHRLLRSDQLHDLTEADWLVLHELGLAAVCDLRSADERRLQPSRFPATGVKDIHLPVLADVRSDPRFGARLREQPDAQGAEAMMIAVYRELPGALAPHLARLFGLLESSHAPILVHCTAGKDRTGVAVAVLLRALGADDETIRTDYLRTLASPMMTDASHRANLARKVSAMLGVPCTDEMMAPILGVREAYLGAAFDEIDRRYGSMADYLRVEAGLDAARIARLRDRCLDD